MIAILIDLLCAFFLNAVVEVAIFAGLDGLEALQRHPEPAEASSPMTAGALAVLLGAAASFFFYLAVPHPLFSNRRGALIALAILGIVAGVGLRAYRWWLKARRRPASHLASFWAGVIFALAFAGTRFLLFRWR